jgi:hypothetical protein
LEDEKKIRAVKHSRPLSAEEISRGNDDGRAVAAVISSRTNEAT